MKDFLTIVPTALRPTITQAEQLHLLFQAADDLHLSLRRWLRIPESRRPDLKSALQCVADGTSIPDVHDDDVPLISEGAVTRIRELQHTDLPPQWRKVLPPGVMATIIGIEVKRLALVGTHLTARQALALIPLDRVPLDDAVLPVDMYHVHVAGVGLVVADHWALPRDLSAALTQQAGEVALALAHDRSLKLECLARGEMQAMADFYASSELSAAFRTARLLIDQGTDPVKPHRVAHASLVLTTDVTGQEIFLIHWSIRLPSGYLPRATVEDTLGIDVGYRHLAVTVNAQETNSFARRIDPREGLLPPDPQSQAQQLAYSQGREALLEVHRDQLESLVFTALLYREVHVEELNWENIREGVAGWTVEAMNLLGVPHITRWLRMLAVASGTRLVLVDPAHTSVTCARCAESGTPRRGTRPPPFTHLHCPVHGAIDADENGARMIRLSKGRRII